MRSPLLALCVVLSAFCSTAHADDFWKRWGDGLAELDGYSLVQPRYGAPREGTAVLVFVTEDMSDSARVKADPGKHPASDVYPVMKLNFVKDFQTGIYDYNVLTSTFVKTEDIAAPPMKVSFSSQEWCGHVYAQWLRQVDKLVGISHSYFDGEGDATSELAIPPGGIFEDQLPILVRGLRGDWLAPGEKRTAPLLPTALTSRLLHRTPAFSEATFSRSASSIELTTVLGTVRAFTITVDVKAGERTTYTIEDGPERRLLGWISTSGEDATLLGSKRLAYWKLHEIGDEKYLHDIGLLAPHPPRAANAPPTRRTNSGHPTPR